MNIYGPSAFPKKQAFLDFLGWVKDLTEIGKWVIGGDLNLISNLEEKKDGRQSLNKFKEAFNNFLTQIPMVDMEIGVGWFTWNNKCGGEHIVASHLDRFLVPEHIVHGTGEIRVDVLPIASSNH